MKTRTLTLRALALLPCCTMNVNAQKRVIEGWLKDKETGNPLLSVEVCTRYTMPQLSGTDGRFMTMAYDEDSLTFRIVGYETLSLAVKDVRKVTRLKPLAVQVDDVPVGRVKSKPILDRLFQRMEEDHAKASGRESHYTLTTLYAMEGTRAKSVTTSMRTTFGMMPLPLELTTSIEGVDLSKGEGVRRALDKVYLPNGEKLMKFDFTGNPIRYGGYLEEECVVVDGKVQSYIPEIPMLNGYTHLISGTGPMSREARGWELAFVPLHDRETTDRYYKVTADKLDDGTYRLAFSWKGNAKVSLDNRCVVTGYAYVDPTTWMLKGFRGQALFHYDGNVYLSFVATYGNAGGVASLESLTVEGKERRLTYQSSMKRDIE